MTEIQKIALPTRPQPDTLVAIFLLRTFGKAQFPSIEQAVVEVMHVFPKGETFDTLLTKGTLALDLGGGALDHHGTDVCTSELVAKYLNIEKDPALTRLLQYARRDDKDGKGTLSSDAIDRAFGLSGLIASLNKLHTNNPQLIVDAVMPLLEAHYASAREHHVELPQDVGHKKKSGEYTEETTRQGTKSIKIAYVVSDKPSMPTYLRSQQGPRADVVVQKLEHTNHLCVLTRQERKIDLSKVAALIRLREGELMGLDMPNDAEYLGQTARVAEIENWYYDPATNSLLNGGPHNREVAESLIPWDELKRIVKLGLEIGGTKNEPAKKTNASLYLSINIPESIGKEILSTFKGSEGVKVHSAKNLHITLEHFGQKTPEEAERMAQVLAKALAEKQSFDIILSDKELTQGSPEGYTNTKAWFLHIDSASGADDAAAVREAALAGLKMPSREKMLHVTLASLRDRAAQDGVASFADSFEVSLLVTEIVLMQSVEENGKRVYKAHSTFPLKP